MQAAREFIPRAADHNAQHKPTPSLSLVPALSPRLFQLRETKACRLLAVFLVIVPLLPCPAFAHDPYFFPIGWSGPWYNGVANSDHPENLCAWFPSHACLVASTSYWVEAW